MQNNVFWWGIYKILLGFKNFKKIEEKKYARILFSSLSKLRAQS